MTTPINDAPGIDELRADLYSQGREQLEELMLQREQYPWAERVHARISRLLGSAHLRSGKLDEARVATDEALAGFEGLRGTEFEHKAERGVAAALAQSADLLAVEGRREEAVGAREQALQILERLWETGQQDDDLCIDLSTLNQRVGTSIMNLRRFEEGRPYLERALMLVESRADGGAADPRFTTCYLSALSSLSYGERFFGDQVEGARYSARAHEMIEQLLAVNPMSRSVREHLLEVLTNESGMWNHGLEFAECEALARRGLELVAELERDNPGYGEYAKRKATLESNLLVAVEHDGRGEEAADSYRDVVQRERQRVTSEGSYEARMAFARVLFRQTQNLIALRRDREAFEASSEAVELLERLATDRPDDSSVRNYQGLQGLVHARLSLRTGREIDFEYELNQVFHRVTDVEPFSQPLASFIAEAATDLQNRGRASEASAALQNGLTALETGARAGYLVYREVRDDPDLTPYRGRDRFEALLEQLASKTAADSDR